MGIKKADYSTMTIRGSIQALKKGELDLNHRIQRRNAWSEEQKQLLIASILENCKIPGIVIVKENGIRYALDGKQRITATIEYFEGKFPLSNNENHFTDIDFEEFEGEEQITINDIKGKYYADLPQEVKNKLHKFEFKLDVYSNLTNEQIIKLFKRYNGGTPLKQIELLRSDADFMLDEIIDLANMPFFANVVNITDKAKNSFGDQEVILQSLALLYFQGDTGIDIKKDVKNFVDELAQLKQQGRIEFTNLIDEAKCITEYLSKALSEPVKDMRKSSVPMVFLTAKDALMKEVEVEKFGLWVIDFLKTHTGRGASVKDYKAYLEGGTAKKENVTGRAEVMLKHFANNIDKYELPKPVESEQPMTLDDEPVATDNIQSEWPEDQPQTT